MLLNLDRQDALAPAEAEVRECDDEQQNELAGNCVEQRFGASRIHEVRNSQENQRKDRENVDNFGATGRVDFELAFNPLQLLQAVADALESVGNTSAAFEAHEKCGREQCEAFDSEP